jgi:hypothetical protein
VTRRRPLVTLTTDFGPGPYVPQLKGILLGICPDATLVDLAHDIPPQDLVRAAWLLQDVVGAFPPGTVHLVVVDPGVGTRRRALAVRTGTSAPGQYFVGPDNGVLGAFTEGAELRVLENPAYRRASVSPVFHGRDLFAPAAAHLAAGAPFQTLGPRLDDPLVLALPQPVAGPDEVAGEIVFADAFGNLVTNITAAHLPPAAPELLRVELGAVRIDGLVRTYGDAAPGALVALVGSAGRLEIAVREGNAREWLQLAAPRGVPVRVSVRRPMG